MRNFLLSIVLICGNCFFIHAQENNVNKEAILKLYHAANQAENNNNREEALKIYKIIQSIDSTLPIPDISEYAKTIYKFKVETTTFTTPTMLVSASNAADKFVAEAGDTFEGEINDGKVVQGKVIRNGKVIKLFFEKSNY